MNKKEFLIGVILTVNLIGFCVIIANKSIIGIMCYVAAGCLIAGVQFGMSVKGKPQAQKPFKPQKNCVNRIIFN